MLKSSDYKVYSKFIEILAKKLNKFYYSQLNRSFKVSNKLKGRGYDPVTSADKAFEKFIRKEIQEFYIFNGECSKNNLPLQNLEHVCLPLWFATAFATGLPLRSPLLACTVPLPRRPEPLRR